MPAKRPARVAVCFHAVHRLVEPVNLLGGGTRRRIDREVVLAVRHPDVVLDADAGAVRMGAPARLIGSAAVAQLIRGRAQAAQPAIVDGSIGMVWIVKHKPRVVWDLFIDSGHIVHVDMHADPVAIRALHITPL